jgi:hypothetical protein
MSLQQTMGNAQQLLNAAEVYCCGGQHHTMALLPASPVTCMCVAWLHRRLSSPPPNLCLKQTGTCRDVGLENCVPDNKQVSGCDSTACFVPLCSAQSRCDPVDSLGSSSLGSGIVKVAGGLVARGVVHLISHMCNCCGLYGTSGTHCSVAGWALCTLHHIVK